MDTTKYPLMQAWTGPVSAIFSTTTEFGVYGWINGAGNSRYQHRIEYADIVLGGSQQHSVGSALMAHRAASRHGSNRPGRLGIPADGGLRHRLPVFHGGGLVQPTIAGAQQPLWMGPDGRLHQYLRSGHRPRNDPDGRPLGRDSRYRNAVRADNYMGTHSLLFTVDVYTETGVMATVMLDEQWTVQAARSCRRRHGPVVRRGRSHRDARRALGIGRQQRFVLHGPERHQ